ncbi:uncharacterized protein LOC130014847 [Mercurialis annua]|uniref:uncharacterized protein LOC130014847 n=1 Tax=Mercurialis annua TaxID=3986 RepID=UPI0024AE2A0B|nr:uncharacterized protein LOC130014847 [Mercurialis annua]
MVSIDPINTAGGLFLMWSDAIDVSVQLTSAFWVVCSVTVANGVSFDIIFCHLNSHVSVRRNQFASLLSLKAKLQNKVVIMGDFNDITHPSEKEGGLLYVPAAHVDFINFIYNMQLIDMGFVGPAFTWSNHQSSPNLIQERLDRSLATNEWTTSFPHFSVHHLKSVASDYCPLLLHLSNLKRYTRARFHYDYRWNKYQMLLPNIASIWASPINGSSMFQIHRKLQMTRQFLLSWKKQHFQNPKQQILDIHSKLTLLHQQPANRINWDQIHALERELLVAYQSEEHYWFQKSKQNWLRWGDSNTKFFHAKTRQRQQKNQIQGLRDANGIWVDTMEDIVPLVLQYFQHLYTNTNPTTIHTLFHDFPAVVTNQMNVSLMQPFTDDEIKEATFSIHYSKSPGIDGFTSAFYQHYWSTIGPSIISTIKQFFNGGHMLRSMNHTIICLIPKVRHPQSVSDLRLISLCTVFYKIISKVLTNRLQKVLPDLIPQVQNAFIKGRSISDNILLVHEVLHYFQHHKSQKNRFLGLKLDISKAYDRIEWQFLEFILAKWGFGHQFIRWIMQCVSTVTFSIQINGGCHGYFTPSRGLRQGDPLSPLLFVLCSQGLSFLIKQASEQHLFSGVKLNRHCPPISHLLFADDSIIFSSAAPHCLQSIKSMLQQYGDATGQLINYSKSGVFFSANVDSSYRNYVSTFLTIPSLPARQHYLGLPAILGQNKSHTFGYLLHKIQTHLTRWQGKFLSHSGKEVLLKAIITAIPVYTMMCFRLPKSFCKRINQLMMQFWWGGTSEFKHMVWVSWRTMCRSKKQGGLGFKHLFYFNQALLAKQIWRISQDPNSILYQGCFWQINSGLHVRPLMDPWLLNDCHFLPRLQSGVSPSQVPEFVGGLFRPYSLQWDEVLIRQLFIPADVSLILSIPLPYIAVPDRLLWKHTRHGQYTVKSGYYVAASSYLDPTPAGYNSLRSVNWQQLWNISIPPKVRLFLWRSLHNGLATGTNLSSRVSLSSACCYCGMEETLLHLLFDCPFVQRVWYLSGFGLLSILVHLEGAQWLFISESASIGRRNCCTGEASPI